MSNNVAELRLKVWQSVDVEPRVIFLQDGFFREVNVKCWSQPILLRVNSESRTFAMSRYKAVAYGFNVRIDLAFDILFFNRSFVMMRYLEQLKDISDPKNETVTYQQFFSDVKHIVIGEEELAIDEPMYDTTVLKGLESLTILTMRLWMVGEPSFAQQLVDLWKDCAV